MILNPFIRCLFVFLDLTSVRCVIKEGAYDLTTKGSTRMLYYLLVCAPAGLFIEGLKRSTFLRCRFGPLDV